jgi:hypothetical protein
LPAAGSSIGDPCAIRAAAAQDSAIEATSRGRMGGTE